MAPSIVSINDWSASPDLPLQRVDLWETTAAPHGGSGKPSITVTCGGPERVADLGEGLDDEK